MHLKMDRENLLKAVGRTLGVVDRRGPMVILSHFLLEAQDDQVAVAATDLEVSFKGFFPAEVLEAGALTLPAHYLHNLIKELPGTSLDLTGTEASKVKIQAGESRYQLIGLPADQFPPVPEIADLTLVEVDSAVLKEMIEKTIFSVSVDDLQYHLSGIFWERLETPEGFQLRMVSTDGHRLTMIERPLPASEQFAIEEGILIPRKGVAEILRLVAEEDKVGLGLSKKSLALQTDNKYLFIRLLEKKFPEYRRIIPESFSYRFVMSRQALYETIRRISLLSTERFRGVVLTFGVDTLEVTFHNPEVGEGREVIPLSLAAGDQAELPMQIGFNARYFLEPLSVMTEDVVFLELNDRERPCKLLQQDDPNYFAIIMPMSL